MDAAEDFRMAADLRYNQSRTFVLHEVKSFPKKTL